MPLCLEEDFESFGMPLLPRLMVMAYSRLPCPVSITRVSCFSWSRL